MAVAQALTFALGLYLGGAVCMATAGFGYKQHRDCTTYVCWDVVDRSVCWPRQAMRTGRDAARHEKLAHELEAARFGMTDAVRPYCSACPTLEEM